MNYTSFDISKSLLSNFATSSFGKVRHPHAYFNCAPDVGVFGLQRTPEGGYFLRLTRGGTTFRSYTHPSRAMNVPRLAYDVTKLLRAHDGEVGLSQVVKV